MNTECRLYDLNSLNPSEYVVYTEPIYTKIDGHCGYLVVSNSEVLLFLQDDTGLSYDNISSRFKVEYVNLDVVPRNIVHKVVTYLINNADEISDIIKETPVEWEVHNRSEVYLNFHDGLQIDLYYRLRNK